MRFILKKILSLSFLSADYTPWGHPGRCHSIHRETRDGPRPAVEGGAGVCDPRAQHSVSEAGPQLTQGAWAASQAGRAGGEYLEIDVPPCDWAAMERKDAECLAPGHISRSLAYPYLFFLFWSHHCHIFIMDWKMKLDWYYNSYFSVSCLHQPYRETREETFVLCIWYISAPCWKHKMANITLQLNQYESQTVSCLHWLFWHTFCR